MSGFSTAWTDTHPKIIEMALEHQGNAERRFGKFQMHFELGDNDGAIRFQESSARSYRLARHYLGIEEARLKHIKELRAAPVPKPVDDTWF